MKMIENRVQLTNGPVRFREGGSGEPIVFVHGLLVDGQLWRDVAARLEGDFRVIVPDLPLGCEQEPFAPGTDLSPPGLARIVVEFLDALGLERATLVGNDTGGAICQIVATRHPDRVARRSPLAYGWLMREFDDERCRAWVRPVRESPAVRAGIAKILAGFDSKHTLQAAAHFKDLDIPVLLAWAPGDRFFKLANAERMAAEIPNARLERIEDSYTFVSIDQPARTAELIAGFVREPVAVA